MTDGHKKPHLAVYADWHHFADVEIPEAEFVAVVRNALPGCVSSDDEIEAARDDVQWLFGKAHGQFNWSEFRTPRSVLLTRIDRLEFGLATAFEILASSGHKRTKEDSDLLSFISKAGPQTADENTSINQEIATCRDAISALLVRTRNAKSRLEKISGAGNPPLLWYEPIVEASILLATKLEIPLTTAGDRARNPHETPFTWLTLRLEEFLPEQMKSDQLSGCARRIERSATWARTSRDKKRSDAAT